MADIQGWFPQSGNPRVLSRLSRVLSREISWQISYLW